MPETLRRVEKSPAGSANIMTATLEWLGFMEGVKVRKADDEEEDGMAVASRLVDWALTTPTCREELDAAVEKRKPLKSENIAALKQLRQGKELYIRQKAFLTSRFRRTESRLTQRTTWSGGI